MTLDLPQLGLGLGLRYPHFEHVLTHRPEVDWFEIISENFMADFGWSRHMMLQIREHYPMVMHGVSLSIGSTDPINFEYLTALKQLAKDVEPAWVSDHLCWTGVQNANTHDLLPVPLTEESLAHICERISQVQDYLGRPLILENPSTYLQFQASEIDEWTFLNRMSQQTGCGLLIDVNNIYVSARNHGFNALDYIDNLDHRSIVQIHLGGHTDLGDHCIDTHDQAVCAEVWQLYARLTRLCGSVSTLLEWDANVPDFPELLAELKKAEHIVETVYTQSGGSTIDASTSTISNPIDFLIGAQH